ncbi:hypothetical protein [Profundibacter amoris]
MELGLIGAATAQRLFLRFFPDHPDLGDRFCRALGDRRFSPAEVQSWLLAQSNDAEEASMATGLLQAPVAIAAQ